MRVLRYYGNDDVRLETQPRPTIADGEVLVRVNACGICGSDVMEWFRLPKGPRILGHEIAGVVVASRATAVAVGERVVVRNQSPCGTCHACRTGGAAVCEASEEIEPGGMAEYIRLPARIVAQGLFRLPDNLSFAAGTLAEPLACVLHAQKRARLGQGQCVVVVGCGLFGLLHLQVARLAGASPLIAIEKTDYRRRAAIRCGATRVLRPEDSIEAEVRAAAGGRPADLAIVATGSPGGFETALRALGRHGAVLLFGMPPPDASPGLSLNAVFWRKELSIVSSYGPGDMAFSEGLRLMETGMIDAEALITHRTPFPQAVQGFQTTAAAGESIKVVLEGFEGS